MLTATNYKYRNFTTSKAACFISVDPKHQEYPQMSSYTAMGNNPVTNIDPDGQAFTHAMKIWISNYRQEMENRLESRLNTVNRINKRLELEKKGKNRPNKITDLNEKLKEANENYNKYDNEFKQIKKEITKLGKSKVLYDIEVGDFADINSNLDNRTYYNKPTKTVMMRLTKNSEIADKFKYFSHELKHMYQFEKGTLSIQYRDEKGSFIKTSGKFLYSLDDEKEAVARQLFFGHGDTNSLSKNMQLHDSYAMDIVIAAGFVWNNYLDDIGFIEGESSWELEFEEELMSEESEIKVNKMTESQLKIYANESNSVFKYKDLVIVGD